MIPNDLSPFDIDDGSERRRILAKVYSLLIRLEEEQEKPSFPPEALDKKDEESGEPVVALTEHSDKEACPELESDVAVPSIEQTNNSVP